MGRLVMPGPHEAESQGALPRRQAQYSPASLSAERSTPAADSLPQHHILKWGDLEPSQRGNSKAPDPPPMPGRPPSTLRSP